MKFSDVIEGTLARRTVDLRLDDRTVSVDVRVLAPGEELAVLENAAKFAKARSADHVGDGDPIYDYGRWVHTIAVACVDPVSPKDAPAPFFDKGVAQILDSKRLTRAHIAYLFEHQRALQDAVSPYTDSLSQHELVVAMHKIAGGDFGPFFAMRPETRWLFIRGLAVQLVNSPELKSFSSEFSSGTSKTPESSP